MKELLSPVGNKECLYTAIHNGADAIYLGGKSFGARKFAGNFTDEELLEAVNYSHLYGVKVYVTVNTIIYEEETEDFLSYIDYLYLIGVDALIMQDIGMISLVRKRYPDIEIHASTQLHNHNNNGIKLLKDLGVTRVVLDREMSLEEIQNITVDIEKEVFIYGALCNSYSGCCLISSMNGGRSGNRGECVQSCRLPYKLIKNNTHIDTPNKYLLSTKELNTTNKIKELMESDITSFKIEGRMKSPAYVGYITKIYRKLIDNYYNHQETKLTTEEEDNLKILFNRDFTEGYLFKDKVMNTMSSNHQGLEIGSVIEVTSKKIKIKLSKKLYQEDGIRFRNSSLGMIANKIYNSKDKLVNSALPGDIIYLDNKINLKEKDTVLKTSSIHLEKEITNISPKKVPITIDTKMQEETLIVTFKDNFGNVAESQVPIFPALNRPTTKEEIEEKLTKLGSTPFEANKITTKIKDNIFVSMKAINDIRRTLTEELIKKRTEVKRTAKQSNTIPSYQEETNYPFEISVLARTEAQLSAALSCNANRIYVDAPLYEKYKENKNIYLRLPRVGTDTYPNAPNVLVTELGGINHYKDRETSLVGDYYLNVVNNASIKFLLNNNVDRVTISPEVDYAKLDNLIKDKIEIIIYGRLELMLTKSCPVKETLNTCPCLTEDKYYLEDINKNKYPIIHHNCLTHIMHYKNIDCLNNIDTYKKIGIRSYRLELFEESPSEVINLINKIKA